MKTKEEILKEFSEIFDNLKISNMQANGLLLLISKAIAQTREETIREVEDSLPEETFDDTYNYALKEVRRRLNKLKK